jgi:predicted DNA-binding transcriptional regulator AlpA
LVHLCKAEATKGVLCKSRIRAWIGAADGGIGNNYWTWSRITATLWEDEKSNRGESSMDNDFLTEQDLSERLHISLGTLRRWRLESRGPKFRKLGTLVRYGEYDLSQWMESQPSGGTRELGRIPPSKAQSSHGGVRKTA